MPSTKIQLQHDRMLDGLDRSFPSHLTPENAWFTQYNFRTLREGVRQVPRHQPFITLPVTNCPVLAMPSVPIGKWRQNNTFLISDRVYRVKTASTYETLPNDSSALYPLWTTDGYKRWAWTVFEDQVYFTNLDTETLVITSHPMVRKLGAGAVMPKAQYIESYFDHLVWGNVDYNGVFPHRILWSNLRNFSDLETAKYSESDHYDLLENLDSVHQGLTGLRKFGEFLVAYTGSTIAIGTYVGLPTVMRWQERVRDIGNDFPYSLVAVDHYHFFISEKWQNFAMFDGSDTPQPIGDPIADYFFSTLSNDPVLRYRVHGYVDHKQREVVWAYCSQDSTGDFDQEVVLSLRTRKWYARSCPNITAFAQGGRCPGINIDEITGTFADQTNEFGDWGAADVIAHFWASGNLLLQESTDPASALVTPLPYLETGDFLYGDMEAMKEMETLCISAFAEGFQVWVSTRSNISDPVVWTLVKQTWTSALREGRLSLPRLNGRVFRFKFIPVPAQGTYYVDDVKWDGFVENVYGAKQVEK